MNSTKPKSHANYLLKQLNFDDILKLRGCPTHCFALTLPYYKIYHQQVNQPIKEQTPDISKKFVRNLSIYIVGDLETHRTEHASFCSQLFKRTFIKDGIYQLQPPQKCLKLPQTLSMPSESVRDVSWNEINRYSLLYESGPTLFA